MIAAARILQSPSRAQGRLLILPRALASRLRRLGRRRRPQAPASILIAHHLLFGDTLCLTPLLAKCRERYPDARILLTVPQSVAGLYAGRPYGVTAVAYDPFDPASLARLLDHSGFDLALVPGENRFAWLAQAMDAGWIAGFGGDRPEYKNWLLDERVPFPPWPWNWADVAATLVPGPAPRPYDPRAWPDPPCEPYERPSRAYCVLHVGARNPLRNWQPGKWRALARVLEGEGLEVVWSGGKTDQAIVREIDPDATRRSCAGALSLPQLWHLLKSARLLVCPDTGVAHLARVVGVPTVALFGPGSVILSGAGEFWRASPYRAVWLPEVPCRDQRLIFKREIPGMRRCVRFAPECTDNICMRGITVDMAFRAARELLGGAG